MKEVVPCCGVFYLEELGTLVGRIKIKTNILKYIYFVLKAPL